MTRPKDNTPARKPEQERPTPDGLKKLLQLTREADRLEKFLEERDGLDASTMSMQQIKAAFDERDQLGMISGDHRDLRQQAALRDSLDRWLEEQRPGFVAHLQRLREEQRRIENSLRSRPPEATAKKQRGRPRDDSLDALGGEVRQLRDQGRSWGEVAQKMRQKHPERRFSRERCRQLYDREPSAAPSA